MSPDVYLPTNEEQALPFVETEAGRCVPVFSSLEALEAYRPEGGPYVRMPREALPVVCPADVGVLLDGSVALSVDAAAELTKPLVGEPSEEPVELLDALRAFCSTRDGVRAAYRASVVPTAGPPVIAVGFDVDDGVDELALLEETAQAIGDERLVLAPLREGGELARYLRERTLPFWTR
nr:SseB protein [uncultured bacterium]